MLDEERPPALADADPGTTGNVVWVIAITLPGILLTGAGILGAEIFRALFAALLASVLLFGSARRAFWRPELPHR